MSKFNNKYRIESTRINDYDYSKDGYYYLTLCSKDKRNIFSEIKNGNVILNTLGNIVEFELKNSCEIRKEIFLDEYVIMPNHLHIIILINQEADEMTHLSSKHSHNSNKKSLSTFFMGFKQAVTRSYRTEINDTNFTIWQPRFYEHIIRSEKSLFKIRNYILNNPFNWDLDEYNK